MTEEKSSRPEAEQSDLSLTAIIKALDSGEKMPDSEDKAPEPAFDPNATMDYKQAGASFPEFPFANESNATTGGTSSPSPSAQESQKARAASIFSSASAPASSVETQRAPMQSTERGHSTSVQRSPRAAQVSTRVASAGSRTSQQAAYRSTDYSGAQASAFKPIDAARSSYRIRGGGSKLNLATPVVIIAAVVFMAIGIGIFAFGANNIIGTLSNTSSGTDFGLTTTETREAIDSRIPYLIGYIDAGIEDSAAALTAAGQFVYANDRYQPDSPDASAVGSELISMPTEMTTEQLSGYYGGSYSAYTPEELAQYFNGAYTFDLARGDLGSWNKLKYVNLNATSMDDEMSHLAALQELTGDTVTISEQGYDSRGNKVIQGQKVIDGERVLYFKIAACPFNDVYSSQKVSDTSVYITCTLATYDFYTGADTITAA